MRVILPDVTEPIRVTREGTHFRPKQEVNLVIERQEIEDASGMAGGPGILRIRAEDEDGVGAYFWISAKYNKRGQPVVSLTAERGDGKVTKSVTGVCNVL